MSRREEILYYIEGFDVVRWLDREGIEYSESGRNVSRGWVGVQCPFCDDPSDHLGINLSTNTISCFRCPNGSGTIVKFIMKVKRCGFNKALKILKEFGGGELKEREIFEKEEGEVKEIDLGRFGFEKELSPMARKYLLSRNFQPEILVRKYGVMDGGVVGRYAYRIIIPFRYEGKVVGFTGRDYVGRGDRYRTLEEREWGIKPSRVLYNVETVKEGGVGVVVEGATDVWRMGDGACAIIGLKFTRHQLKQLIKKRLRRIVIMLDEGARQVAENMAHDLGSFTKAEVLVCALPKGDPGGLSEEQAKWLRSKIFGKKH